MKGGASSGEGGAPVRFSVFTKDRACQLDLLLSSVEKWWPWAEIVVRTDWSAEPERKAYLACEREHESFEFLPQSPTLMETVRGDLSRARRDGIEYFGWLVDDIVVTAEADIRGAIDALRDDSVLCSSLRLHPQITYCYPSAQVVVAPQLDGSRTWDWSSGEGDWGYPMSIDGNLFRLADLELLIDRVEFGSPNEFEAVLSTCAGDLGRGRMHCQPAPCMVNVPENRVQNVYDNRHGGGDPKALNRCYLGGDRLDPDYFSALRNIAPHYPRQLKWRGRKLPIVRQQRPITCDEIADLVGYSPLVLEVGAYDGGDVENYLRTIKGAEVHAFEPDPRAIALFEGRGIVGDRCTLHKVAVGAMSGDRPFYQSTGSPEGMEGQEWCLSGSVLKPKLHLDVHPWCRFETEIQARCTKLDDWYGDTLRGRPTIDFLKADVQGAEGELIDGAPETLSRTRYLYTEFDQLELYEGQPTLFGILSKLPDFAIIGFFENNVLLKNEAYGRSIHENWFRENPVPHETKVEILRGIAARHGLSAFVETGTYQGDTVAALLPAFERIYSIELGAGLYSRACTRFSDEPEVRLVHGDSAEALAEVLRELEDPALFWLDAHYSGGITCRGAVDTPILLELELVSAAAKRGSVVVIDDARMFGDDPAYPSIREVRDLVRSRLPGSRVSVVCDTIQIVL